jgi:hypothetical protein
MGIESNKFLINQLRASGVKVIGFHEKGGVAHIEFFRDTPQVQAVTSMPQVTDMPPDDVMLFAATEDPDEAMKARTES